MKNARAATTEEKASLRAEGDWSEWHLGIQVPQTVFTCRINQSFTSIDSIVELIYDTPTGDETDVIEGMTAFISAVEFGAYEKGIVRIRKAATSDTLYIAETSNVQFLDGDYVTVVDLMPPYPRDLRVPGGVPQMDYDIQYGLQPVTLPMPILGPIAAVMTLESDGMGGYVSQDFHPLDPSASYSPDGEDIDSFLFACPAAASTADLDTTSPTFTIDTPGQYLWSCTVTDVLGRSRTGYRWLLVNPPAPIFTASDPSGDISSGDFSFDVDCYEDASIGDIQERAMVVLYEKSYYNQTEESIGPLAGYANIKCVGWIEDESIQRDPEAGTVSFRVSGPASWLKKIRSFPFLLTDVSVSPVSWTEKQNLTVDKAVAHFLTWYTTLAQIVDVYLSGNTTRIKSVATNGTLWDQLVSMSEKIFATPLCNQFGQLYVEVDSQYLPDAARDALPVIMDVTKADIVAGTLRIERTTVTKKSMIELGGVGPYDGSAAPPLHSRAPGTAPVVYGSPDAPTNYIFADQDDCNFKAGCVLAVENLAYRLSFELAQNNNLISICSLQYLTITLPEVDTPRGIVLTNARLIPRNVSWRRDREVGAINTVLECDMEAIGVDGITYYPPQPPQDNLMDGFGDFGFDDFPAFDDEFPPQINPQDLNDCAQDVPTGPYTLYWDKSVLYGNSVDEADRTATAYFPCTIRPDSFIHETSIIPGLKFFNGALENTTLYAIKEGANVLSIPLDGGEISGISSVDVDGFRVVLAYDAAGGDEMHMLQEHAPTFAQVGSLPVATTGIISSGGTISGLTIGTWYYFKAKNHDANKPYVWSVDGIGPMGNADALVGYDTVWDGFYYWNTFLPEGTFSAVDPIGGVHFLDYRYYFYALKTSYTIEFADTPTFGAFELEAYQSEIVNPRIVTLQPGQLFNVCAAS